MVKRRRKANSSVAVAVVVIFGLVAAFLLFRNPLRILEAPTTGCVRPPSAIALSNRDLELAALTMSSVSVGRFRAVDNQNVVKLLTDASADNLITDYLICVAIQRGDVEAGNTAQIDYLRRFWAFMQSKPSPTPKQVETWQSFNLMPQSKQPRSEGALETTGLETAADGDVLRIVQVSGKDFGVINAGDEPFLFWFKGFPEADVGLAPSAPDAIQIEPGKTITFRAYVLWASQVVKRNAQFALETNIPVANGRLRRNVTIQVDRQRFEAELKKLASEFAEDLIGKNPNTAHRDLRLEEFVSRLAGISLAHAQTASTQELTQRYLLVTLRRLVTERLHITRDLDIKIVSGAFFEAVNWPELAALVFNDIPPEQRRSLPRGLLARTSYLADAPSGDRGMTPMESAYGSPEGAEESLQAYKDSMFQTPLTLIDRSLARRLAERLLASSGSVALGQSLKADLDTTEGRFESAERTYNEALEGRETNSLVLRRDAVAKHIQLRKTPARPAPVKPSGPVDDEPIRIEKPKNGIRLIVHTFDGRIPPDALKNSELGSASTTGFEDNWELAWRTFCRSAGAYDVLITDRIPDAQELGACASDAGRIVQSSFNYPYLAVDATRTTNFTMEQLRDVVQVAAKEWRFLYSRATAAESPSAARLNLAFQPCREQSALNQRWCVTSLGAFELSSPYGLLLGGRLRERGIVFHPLDRMKDVDQASRFATVDGVPLSAQTVKDGSYPWTRSVSILVKVEHQAFRPALAPLVERIWAENQPPNR